MGLLYFNLRTTADLFFSLFFYRLVTILGGLAPKKEEVSILYVLYHKIVFFFFIAILFFFMFFVFFLTTVDAQLDDVGLGFVKNSISAIEKRGTFKTCHYFTNTTGKHFIFCFSVTRLQCQYVDTRRQSWPNIKTCEL